MDGGMEKGEMEMNPPPPQGGPGGPEGGAAAFGGGSVHDFLNVYLWQYIHVFIMGGLLLHFVILPKLRRSWNNQMDKIPVGGHHKSDDAIPREERIRMARERQADKMREVSAADAAVREAKAAKHLEEEQRKQDERMSRTDQFKKGSGQSTGGTKKDDRDESDGNPKRLPKLPGSGQQAYEPFPTGRDGEGGGGGSRYRPTGFSRNCGPKGG